MQADTTAPAPVPIPNYVKPKRISLKSHPAINEKSIQNLIATDQSVLGLGDDLVLIGREVPLPGGGKLDLLLGSGDDERYEVEVQLGPTDPSHIIRTIEYWDLERTRYPDHQHYAVLVAEDITHRLFNVVSLLNKSIPLIAIQMQAIEVGSHFTVVFTTVVDFSGRPDEDTSLPADRPYWEKKAKSGLEIVDAVFGFIQKHRPEFALKYNLGFIQVNKAGRIFLTFWPQKVRTKINVRMSSTAESEALKNKIDRSGLSIAYEPGKYRLVVDNDKFNDHAADIEELVKLGLERFD